MGIQSKYVKPLCAALLLASLPSGTALAEDTATLNVSITGITECTVTGGTIALGTYTGTEMDPTFDVGIGCTGGLGWSLAFDAGNNSFGGPVRGLAGPSGLLIYYLIDPMTGDLLGDAGVTISGVPLTGSAAGLFPVKVLIPDVATQNAAVAPGNYTDTVTLTVTF